MEEEITTSLPVAPNPSTPSRCWKQVLAAGRFEMKDRNNH